MSKKLLNLFKKTDKNIFLILFFSFAFFYKLFLNPGEIIYPARDTITIYFHYKELFFKSLLDGYLPLWDPYIFSGMSFLANPESAFFSFTNIFHFIFPRSFSFGFTFFIDCFLIGVFTYLFAKKIKLSAYSSLVSAIIMMFSGPFIGLIYPAHAFIIDTLTLFPLFLYVFEHAYQKNKLIYSFYGSLVLGFILFSGNIQFGMYIFLSSYIYLILRVLLDKKRKNKILLMPLISLVISLLLFALQLLPTVELYAFSGRSEGVVYDFATNFSLHPKQLLSFIFPTFFGSPIAGNYWGTGNYWSLTGYLGIIPLFLSLFSLCKRKTPFVYIFLILGLFSVLFALGRYGFVFPFFYHFVPFFDNFRVPSRFLFFFAFSLSLLSGIGLDYLFSLERKQLRRIGKYIFYFGFIFLLITFAINFLPLKYEYFEARIFKPYYAIGLSRKLILDQWIFDLFIFSMMPILFSVFLLKVKDKPVYTKYFLLIIITLNLWIYHLPLYKTNATKSVFSEKVVNEIRKDKSLFRVWDQTGELNHILIFNDIQTVGGISAMLPQNYREFLWTIGDHSDSENDVFVDIKSINNTNALSLLNVKYLIDKKNDRYILKKLENTMPRAFIAPNSIETKSFSESLEIIKNSNFDPKLAVYVQDYKTTKGNDVFREIEIKSYSPNKIVFKPFSSKEGFLVLGEQYFPGWKAYDFKNEVKIYKGNAIFRVLPLQSGKHDISFVYDPLSFKIGKYISLVTLIGLVSFFITRRKELI